MKNNLLQQIEIIEREISNDLKKYNQAIHNDEIFAVKKEILTKMNLLNKQLEILRSQLSADILTDTAV